MYYGETHMTVGMKTIESTGLAEIIIGKQRNGPVGSVIVRFDSEFVRFSDYVDTLPTPGRARYVNNYEQEECPF